MIIRDERNDKFIKQISFINEESAQYEFDKFLRELNKYVKLTPQVVFAYEIFAEFEDKFPLKTKLPSVLPLIGNLTNIGLILSNDYSLDMRVREFTTVQIDRTVKVIKRSMNYFSYKDIENGLNELKRILKELSLTHSQ